MPVAAQVLATASSTATQPCEVVECVGQCEVRHYPQAAVDQIFEHLIEDHEMDLCRQSQEVAYITRV